MAGIIKNKDLYSGKSNPFSDVSKSLDIIIEKFKQLKIIAKESSDIVSKEIKTNSKKSTTDIRKLTEDKNKLNEVNKAGIEINKQTVKLEVEKEKLRKEVVKTEKEQQKLDIQRNKEKERQIKLSKKQVKELNNQKSSYLRLTKATNEAQRKLKDLAAAFGTNSKQAKAAQKEFDKLDKKLRKVNTAAKDGRRDVGRYEKGWQGIKKLFIGGLGILGVTAGFSILRSGITSLVTTFSEFEKQTSKVAAISGASSTELKALTAQAQALGEATEKTASQVLQLQLELAKLGFDPKQIENATDSILDLSTAIDADLAQSAKVVGSTLRAYGLEAENTQRVTDVMAAAFSKSSLDINKFQTAMASVAPVAKKFGFSVEDTTALLAQLTDAGFEASSAGTATRKILLNLADANGKLAKSLGKPVDSLEDLLEGLTKLNAEGTDLGEALELTDVRSVAAFATFLEGVDSTRKLAGELENAGGSASRMADIMRDNLAGDSDKAKSAIQGLFINIGKRLNPSLRESTQRFTSFIGRLNDIAKTKASDELLKIKLELNANLNLLKIGNITYDQRIKLINTINTKYETYLPNLLNEKSTLEEIELAQKGANDELLRRISIQAKEEVLQEQIKKVQELRKKQFEQEFKQQEELEILRDKSITSDLRRLRIGARADAAEIKANKFRRQALEEEIKLEKLKISLGDLSLIDDEEVKKGNKLTESQIKLIKLYNVELEKNLELSLESFEIAEKYFNSLKEQTTTLKSLNKELSKLEEEKKEIDLTDLEGLITKENEIIAIKDQIKLYTDLFKLLAEKPEDVKIKLDTDIAFDDDSSLLVDLEKERTDDLKNELEIRESIYNEHFDSLIGLIFNFRSRRQIQDQTLSAEDLARIKEQNEKEAAAYEQLADTLKSIATDILQSQLDNINTEIQAKNQQINELQSSLNRQLLLQQQGAANEFSTEKDKLTKLQAERDKDIAERAKIQKKQEQINTLIQISELATAVATIISSAVQDLGWLGVIAGLAAAAAAIIGFSTYKGEAESAASAEEGGTFVRKGSFIEKGKRHSQGGNRYNALETEKDEMHGILTRDATRKHGDFYEDITNRLNTGSLNPDEVEMYKYSLRPLSSNNIIINNNNVELLKEMQNVSKLLSGRKTPLYNNKGNVVLFDNLGQIKSTQM